MIKNYFLFGTFLLFCILHFVSTLQVGKDCKTFYICLDDNLLVVQIKYLISLISSKKIDKASYYGSLKTKLLHQ